MIPYNTAATLDFIGNDTANVFSITFPTFEDANVEAAVADADGVTTDLVVDTDFTLADIGLRQTNASLTLVSAGQPWLQAGKLKTGYTLFIKFNAIAFQPGKFRDLGRFSPESFEKVLDRLTMSVLAINDKADNAVQMQLGDSGSGVIPPLAGNAGKVLQVNSAGDGFEYGLTADEIEDFYDGAVDAAAESTSSKNTAVTAKDDAEDARDAAIAARNLSQTYKNQAESAKADAETAAGGAGASETAAQTASTTAVAAAAVATTKAAEAAQSAADASTAEGFKDDAEAAAADAESSEADALIHRNAAAASAAASASSATDAQTAEDGAEGFKDEAEGFRDEAEIFKDDAAESEQQAELWSIRTLYDKIVNLSFADSPYTIIEDPNLNTLFIIDDTGGDVDIILPQISTTNDHPNWKTGLVKALPTGNQINVITTGGDTINLQVGSSIQDPKLGMLLYAETPTDWKGLHFMNASVAADALPPGGNAGDILVKNSALNSDATWQPDQSIINALIFG